MSTDEPTLVVIDDDTDGAESLANLLRINGYRVHVANDAFSGESLIDRLHPHGALLDLRMPGIDGCELAARLRARYRDDLVLIAVTGADERDQRVADAFACCDHHLLKPITTTALLKVLPPVD